ncbi:hypothetical protein QAD02_012715 [Eretmocerus hayati]|uniref:Uncharacterized protein n=1 Tax=Eretmocerus hayati TaxID=131215 RepID=A0ACC2P0E8_9HYME|nr:hypothetical protein QAD02_012715 [Eretmocerus hayati]
MEKSRYLFDPNVRPTSYFKKKISGIVRGLQVLNSEDDQEVTEYENFVTYPQPCYPEAHEPSGALSNTHDEPDVAPSDAQRLLQCESNDENSRPPDYQFDLHVTFQEIPECVGRLTLDSDTVSIAIIMLYKWKYKSPKLLQC